MRIKELENVMKLVDAMPRDRQLDCVKFLVREVAQWEDQSSLGMDDWEYALEEIRRRREGRAAEEKRKPPGKGG